MELGNHEVELIRKGRKCVEAHHAAERKFSSVQLRLGRLTLEFAPMGDPAQKTGAYERLRVYAKEIGMDEGTLKNYRQTAFAWSGTDLRDDEFGYTLIKGLEPVGEKDKALVLLREEKPEGGWTIESAREQVIAQGLMRKPKARGPMAASKRLVRVRDHLASLSADDLKRSDDKVNIQTLREITKEIRRLQRLVETNKKKDNKAESVPA